jgi:hypothetical protein
LAKGGVANYTPEKRAVNGVNYPVSSLVYPTTRASSKLAADLTLAGYRVFEALAISEVLHPEFPF